MRMELAHAEEAQAKLWHAAQEWADGVDAKHLESMLLAMNLGTSRDFIGTLIVWQELDPGLVGGVINLATLALQELILRRAKGREAEREGK